LCQSRLVLGDPVDGAVALHAALALGVGPVRPADEVG
jgi:hypothetical protein